jgi:primosomal protein N' (replication factor Y)
LTHIARRPVAEVDSTTESLPVDADLYVGTEAVFHRLDGADLVAFLDFDQEVLAPRYRAAEEAMSLLAQAARLVGRRENGGRILIQTRMPQHPVLQAAVNADPGSLARAELEIRRQLQQPPEAHWAIVSGSAAKEFIDRVGNPDGIEIMNSNNERWRIRSNDRQRMVEILGNIERPTGRLRIEINPLRA